MFPTMDYDFYAYETRQEMFCAVAIRMLSSTRSRQPVRKHNK
jgi:hypothetical protein